MTHESLESRVRQLTEQVELAENLIRAVEDDALPPAAVPAWERYRARYPRDER
jgi:hypothetical protein